MLVFEAQLASAIQTSRFCTTEDFYSWDRHGSLGRYGLVISFLWEAIGTLMMAIMAIFDGCYQEQ